MVEHVEIASKEAEGEGEEGEEVYVCVATCSIIHDTMMAMRYDGGEFV